MVSFRHKLTTGLQALGVQVTTDLSDTPYDVVLVIGGTRDLVGLWRTKQRQIPIIQRLNGMNWMHRKLKTGLRHYMRAEYGNLILRLIRNRLATHVIYQSHFARQWWEHTHGPTPTPSTVIYNAVDLTTYTPDGPHHRPTDRYRILLVEGSLAGGYELGLTHAIQLAETLTLQHKKHIELQVVGKVSPKVLEKWNTRSHVPIQWVGLVPPTHIPEIDRSAHLLYAADLNAACPNAVIEALACGLPVLAFDTGALPELLSPQAGRIVPYGSDPWELDPPDIPALADAALEILHAEAAFRTAARHHAEELFSLPKMVDQYLRVLLE
jgi:glycosyltransferase involved in cell wall biosynthesis